MLVLVVYRWRRGGVIGGSLLFTIAISIVVL